MLWLICKEVVVGVIIIENVIILIIVVGGITTILMIFYKDVMEMGITRRGLASYKNSMDSGELRDSNKDIICGIITIKKLE